MAEKKKTVKEQTLQILIDTQGKAISGEEIAKRLGVTRSAVWKGIQNLQKEGYDVEGTTKRGYVLNGLCNKLSREAILKHIKQPSFPMQIKVYDEVVSTNLIAKEMAETGEQEGLVILAEMQTGGRGRLGRDFFSPKGTGIYMSMLLRPQIPMEQSILLTVASAVATAEAIEEVFGGEIEIKWVNDVWKDGKKVSGILTEGSISMETGELEYMVVGIGINVFVPQGGFPEPLREIATAMAVGRDQMGEIRNLLVAKILQKFWNFYTNIEKREFYEKYKKRCFVIGKQVFIEKKDSKIPVKVLDLDEQCRLVVQYESGEIAHLQSGEISVRIE